MKLIYKIILSVFVLYGLYLIWAIFAFGGGCNNMEGEIHYIPQNFVGKVRIIFDFQNGSKMEYENSRRVYKIPITGELYTQFDLNHGWTSTDKSHKFFYIYDDSLIPIRKLISTKDFEDIDSNLVYIMEYGITSGTVIDGKEYDANIYIVDTLKNKKKYKLFE